MSFLYQVSDYVLLGLGLGFVIFFHELGHFLAAKYADVKVEQFAVGFGPAILAWRKGIGLCWGTTIPAYERRLEQALVEEQHSREKTPTQSAAPASATDAASYESRLTQAQMHALGEKLGIGETEYRLNWIPLGGYVKMLGQDDLKPGVTDQDPRAYNNKSVRARMLIVSAGVIMNVILAAIGFMIVFMIGYPVPPSTVGGVVSMSPASRAARADGTMVGLQPGDKIVTYAGKQTEGDFSKILLNVALTHDGTRVPIEIRHVNGNVETLYATPEKMGDDSKGLVALGITQPFDLQGPEFNPQDDRDDANLDKTELPDVNAIKDGDVITQINGQDVGDDVTKAAGIAKLYAALEASDGKPVDLTVRSTDGKIRHTTVTAHFGDTFDKSTLSILGLSPRGMIVNIDEKSKAFGLIKPGAVVTAVDGGSDHLPNPTPNQIRATLNTAGDKEMPVSLTVLDPGSDTPRQVQNLALDFKVGGGHLGLGVGLGFDEQHLVVAETVSGSSADGKIPAGATLKSVDGKPIANWFELRRIVQSAKPDQVLAISYLPTDGDKEMVANVRVTSSDIDAARQITIWQTLSLRPMVSPLHTHNPLVALEWGVGETRDLILQFYLTLQRMVTGDVALNNVMGPVGMVHAGAQVASRGWSWLIWFLCNISANLAVVNFLPIPIVDGGLFTLLILERIQGKPLSAEAQRIVQMVGLVLILGVFVLVTFQDIARMHGY
jgi:regulator of sigma E protease